jgi:hypothetical protein
MRPGLLGEEAQQRSTTHRDARSRGGSTGKARSHRPLAACWLPHCAAAPHRRLRVLKQLGVLVAQRRLPHVSQPYQALAAAVCKQVALPRVEVGARDDLHRENEDGHHRQVGRSTCCHSSCCTKPAGRPQVNALGRGKPPANSRPLLARQPSRVPCPHLGQVLHALRLDVHNVERLVLPAAAAAGPQATPTCRRRGQERPTLPAAAATCLAAFAALATCCIGPPAHP